MGFLTSLSVLVTYPQAWHLRTGLNDFGDPLLNSWTLAWVGHAVRTQPLQLFDANIFYPEPATLALSEALLLPGLLVAPLHSFGVGPITLHNLTLFSAYVLSGLTMFLLVRHLTSDWLAALIAAAIFTIYPLRTEHYPRLQLQLTYLMPFALLQFHQLGGDTRRRSAPVLLGFALAGLFLSCVYYAIYFATVLPLIAVIVISRSCESRRGTVVRLLIAGLLAALVSTPVALPYLRNRGTVGERQTEEVMRFSAEPRDFLRSHPQNWLYGTPERPGPTERRLFPGFTTLVLASVGALRLTPLALAYTGATLFAADACLGLNGYTYPVLYKYVVPYKALRVPARFGMLVGMFLAILAGLGATAILRRVRRTPVRSVVVVAIVFCIVGESANRPLELHDMPRGQPAVYQWLRDAPPGPVVEYPVNGLEGRTGPQDPTYMYFSTIHWRALLNGYSGFFPPSYQELVQRLEAFPDQASVDYLRARGARYLLVHRAYYIRGDFRTDTARLQRLEGVRLLATFYDRVFGETAAYAVTRD